MRKIPASFGISTTEPVATMMTWIIALFIALSKESLLAPPAPSNMTAAPGEDVSIMCEVPEILISLHCRRTNDQEKYVVVYRDQRILSDEQHPSFKGRVVLQIGGGNLTLILKNVTTNDSGTFECRIKIQEEDPMEHFCTVHLNVTPPGNNRGRSEDGGNENESHPSIPVFAQVILAVVAGVVLVAVVILLWKKCRNPPCTSLSQGSSDSCPYEGNYQNSVV